MEYNRAFQNQFHSISCQKVSVCSGDTGSNLCQGTTTLPWYTRKLVSVPFNTEVNGDTFQSDQVQSTSNIYRNPCMCCRVVGCHIITKTGMLTENLQCTVAGHSTKTNYDIKFKLIETKTNNHPHNIRNAIGVVTLTLSLYYEHVYKLSGIWSHHISFKLVFKHWVLSV